MSADEYALIGLASFVIATVSGLSGYGSGLLMPFVLIPLIGPQAVVPVLAVAALFNNGGRLLAFRDHLDLRRALFLSAAAIPFCMLGASIYARLSGPNVLLVIGTMLLLLVPARRFLRNRPIGTSRMGAVTAGAVYGFLIGGTPGAGVILIPILFGMGLRGRVVIATDSLVSLIVGVFKVGTFQSLGLLPSAWWLYALTIGLCGLPGGYAARLLADRLSLRGQDIILDAGVLAGGIALILRGLGVL